MLTVDQIKEAGKKAIRNDSHVYVVIAKGEVQVWEHSASYEVISIGQPVIAHLDQGAIKYDNIIYNNTVHTLESFVDAINDEYAYLEA